MEGVLILSISIQDKNIITNSINQNGTGIITANEIEIYKPTKCRFCHEPIYLYPIEFAGWVRLIPYGFYDNKKHLCVNMNNISASSNNKQQSNDLSMEIMQK